MRHTTQQRLNGRHRRRTQRSRMGGFSLIELMVVITIIGLLGGIVGVNVMRYLRKANIQATKTQIINLENAVNQYKMEHRRLPDSLQDLVGDEDAILDADEVPTDAWDNEFLYEPQGRSEYILMSFGADGIEGGDGEDADIDRDAARRRDSDEE